MVFRGELSSRTLSYIQLALDCMEKNSGSRAFAYDLQPVLDYPYRMIEKEYNKFLNRLHKIRIRYNLSEIDNPSAYTQVSEPMRFLVESALSERTGQSPLLQALRLMECLDGSLGRSVLARTGSHA